MVSDREEINLLPTESSARRKWTQYSATIAVTLCTFCGGSSIAWSSPALPMLESGQAHFKITADEASWVGSLLAAGALIGALPAGFFADKMGRKGALLLQGAFFVLSWAMILLAHSVIGLYVARTLMGVAVGTSTSLAPLYISEIADENLKGFLCSFVQLMMVSGVLYSYTLGVFCSFRMLNALCGIAPILFILIFLLFPETPFYYLLKNKPEKAEESLSRLRGSNYDVTPELDALRAKIEESNTQNHSLLGFFRKKSAFKGIVICILLMAFQQLCGVNIIIFYSTGIFQNVGPELNASYATVIVGVTQLVATILSVVVMNKVDRRVLLFASSALMAESLILFGVYLRLKSALPAWIPLLALISYIVFFSLGFGPIPYVILGEILPPEIKGAISGLCITTSWIMAFIVVKSFNFLTQTIGPDKTFWFFGSCCIFISIYVVIFVVETRGKTYDEIKEELDR